MQIVSYGYKGFLGLIIILSISPRAGAFIRPTNQVA